MKFKGTKLSKRTVALFAAAILLLSSGGFMGVKAAPAITGNDHEADFGLDAISVQLLENGEEVCNNQAETGSPYCSYHTKMLDDAYNSIIGN